MHLMKLELQGFKTFARKTTLVFLPPTQNRYPLTAIVGPNGSGKSNLADAIRWVLGEQSLKLLRGKQSEDVIFSGSVGKSRAGFAEVSVTLNNEDHAMPIEYAAVTISRSLFRDGTSEYVLNDAKVRLQDIQLLLAEANVGQRSYSVIGQGMVDHILVSTPEERKAFFDDATGVKPLQIKRHEAILKLKRVQENLADVEMLLREIEPRLRSLKRQASRLEKRSEIEQSLYELEARYYGNQWWGLADQLEKVKKQFDAADGEIKRERAELSKLEKEAETLERAEGMEDSELMNLQERYRAAQKKQTTLRDEQFKMEKEMELARVRAQSNWTPLPLSKIVEEVNEVVKGLKALKGLKLIQDILRATEEILKRTEKLSKNLRRSSQEDIKPSQDLEQKLQDVKTQLSNTQKELEDLEIQIDQYAVHEKNERTELIETQRALREKQQQIHLLENRRNELHIECARFEERQNSLIREMNEFMKERAVMVRGDKGYQKDKEHKGVEGLYPEIQRLRYKLELIGGIDPEIMKEHHETNERYLFFATQVDDLKKAIRDTEQVIDELDELIEKQSKEVFTKINKEFERYFKVLFGGGSCRLVKLAREQVEEETTSEEVDGDTIAGIDIQATPPGKKLKALNLLSGGERALTSIALISAIMAVNPSPFVLLDEVDAALDEANTLRFATILQELSKKSQFIIITHNRATMEEADVLYGAMMGDDGISSLLSVHLEDVASNERQDDKRQSV